MPRSIPSASPALTETMERRLLLSGGAQSAFARTAVADLNNDGLPDIVVGATGKGKSANATPVVLLGTGPNTFAAPATVNVPAGAGAAVALGDINGDEILDLITSGSRKAAAGTANPRSPLLLAGVGNGTFGTAGSLNIPKSAGATYAFGVGDFNNDGNDDIVVEGGKVPKELVTADTRGGRQLLLLLGNGTGTPAAPTHIPTSLKQIVGMAAGAFGSTTGDDLVVAGRGGGGAGKAQGITLFRNLTATAGATAIPVTASFGNITDVAAGDFNKDTKLDLVVASKGGTNRGGGLTLLNGNGDGTFAAGAPISSAAVGTGSVDVADFNADTNLDLLTGSARPRGKTGFIGTLATLLNTGTGTFQTPAAITVAGQTP